MRFLGTIATTVLCMVLAFFTVDTHLLGRSLTEVKLEYAALAVLLLLLNLMTAIWRFRVLMYRLGHSPGWRPLFTSFSVGLLGNQFFLNIVGQSVGRAVVLRSSGVPYEGTITATLVERLIAAGVLGAIALAATSLLLPELGPPLIPGEVHLLSLAGGMALVGLSAAVVSMRDRGRELAPAIASLGRAAGKFSPVILLTILCHFFMLAGYWAALLSVGLDTLTLETAGASAVVAFAAAVPISLGGWGVRELSAVAIFGTAGMESATALAGALLVGILLLGLSLALAIPGLWFAVRRGVRVRPRPKGTISTTLNWRAGLAVACGTLTAVGIFFEVQVPVQGRFLAAGASDVFALAGLVCLVAAFVDSRERLAELPRTLLGVLVTFSLLLAFGWVLGYASFGSNSWALVDRGVGWLVVLGYTGTGVAVALLLAARDRRLVLRLFVTAGATLAAWQLALLIVSKLGFPPPEGAFLVPLRGHAGNANAFAFQMTMTAAAAVVADRVGALGAKRLWLAVVLLLTGLAVCFSSSRTGIGVFAMLLVLSVLFATPEERRGALATSVGTLIGVILGAVAILGLPVLGDAFEPGRIAIRTSVLGGDSDPDRWRTLVDGWHLWMERPLFGHGLGGYVESQLAESGAPMVFHSVPLWLMAEMGLIGLAVGLACFVGLSLTALRAMRTPSHRAWGAGLLTVLLCWGAANLLHDFFHQRSFWFFVGMGFGLLPAAEGLRTRWRRVERGESKSAAR